VRGASGAIQSSAFLRLPFPAQLLVGFLLLRLLFPANKMALLHQIHVCLQLAGLAQLLWGLALQIWPRGICLKCDSVTFPTCQEGGGGIIVFPKPNFITNE
jgi:hypothetical protein